MSAMSLLPAFVRARKRNNDSAPKTEALADSRETDLDDNIFDLLPPKPTETSKSEPEPVGSNTHPVDMTDLSRLSIDQEGRLYWDGNPVVTHQRLSMSRAQIVGASVIAVFVVIGAIGAALQGSVAARELACRFGWSASACTLPGGEPQTRFDIPA